MRGSYEKNAFLVHIDLTDNNTATTTAVVLIILYLYSGQPSVSPLFCLWVQLVSYELRLSIVTSRVLRSLLF